MLQDSTVKVCVSVLGKKVHVQVGGSVCTCVYVNVVKKLVKCISWTLISPHRYDFEATKNQSVKTCLF